MTRLQVMACILALSLWGKPVSSQALTEARNGSFERGRLGWEVSGAAEVVRSDKALHGQMLLRCTRNGDMAKQVFIAEPTTQYSVSVWMRTEDVKPSGGSGYAYAAVYEFDFHGNLVAARDFAQLTGTSNWERFGATWTTHQRTFYFEIRLGLYNADGTVLFDAVQASLGAEMPSEYSEPPSVKGDIALIFHEPSFPQNPAAPSLENLVQWLELVGYKPQIVSAPQLSDPNWFNANWSRIGLLVLPNSPYFPLEAHRNLLRLLTKGVDLLTFGGYAFDVPLVRTEGGYQPVRYRQLVEATPLNTNSDFEAVAPDGSAEGWERSHQQWCFVESRFAKSGQRCAAVSIPAELGSGSAIWRTTVKVQTGEQLQLSGWVKTENVKGNGYAFIAFYPFAGQNWVNPQDIAQVRGTTDWNHFTRKFVVPYGVDRVEIRFGIYNAVGTAFFDDLRLERVEFPTCINTHYGNPQDALETSPLQLGMFDAHYKLRNAVKLEWGDWSWEGEGVQIGGYSAVGVLRGGARWKPIVIAKDRFGRICGTAGAIMQHYGGVFAGSTWAFFGVDNIDLTELPDFNEQVIMPLLRDLKRGVFLHGLKSRLACYRPNEPIEAVANISNFGSNGFIGRLVSSIASVDGKERIWLRTSMDVEVAAGETVTVEFGQDKLKLSHGLYRILIRLYGTEGDLVDEMEAGFVVWDGKTFPKRLNFRYADNYFCLNNEPVFMLGTDTWSNWFHSPSQSDPLFWWQQIRTMKDFGLTVFENLQWTRSDYRFNEADWRQLDALIWLCHREGIVYMAGLLVGHDVAVGDDELSRQEKFVAEFASRYRNADGLIYYLNGDYLLRPRKPEQNELRWQVQQTRRWNERLVATIKSVDPNHPVTSEYYRVPVGGIDLRLTLDNLDIANIGYFDEPSRDLYRFAAVFKLTDMRLYGKSLNIGEFGVKTHPAWERELGAMGYHIRRSEDEQRLLFLLLPQYALGLGASKVQNWCWRDDDDRVFPWGLLYPCDSVPKPALKAYRAAALILRYLKPVWRKPEVLLIVPDSNRLSPDRLKVWHAALVAAHTLISLRVDFAVASDLQISDELLDGVKVVFLPSVLSNIPSETEAALERFEGRGGVIYRSDVNGEPALELDVSEASEPDERVRERYKQFLDRAQAKTIRTEPDLPTLHAFEISLQNGVAFVFVNASDKPATFTAFLPVSSLMPDALGLTMSLGAWQPGLVAFDAQGKVFLAEGNGRVFLGDELIAEGNGHFAVVAKDADLREAKSLWLIPIEATSITVKRRKGAPTFKVAEVGEWRSGVWKVLERAKMVQSPSEISITIADDLKCEIVLVR